METTTTELEIKVISATHLWAFNFFQKLSVYATASLTGDHLPSDQAQPQRTPADPDGDGHPDWKSHPMTFLLPPSLNNLFLRFELRHHAGLPFPDRTIGEVTVPLADLLPSAAFRFVDYQVRSSDGKSSNGDFRFAYRLNRVGAHAPPTTLTISGYPRIDDDSAESLWDPIPVPAQETQTPPPVRHQSSEPQPPPAHYPMWPPPPYWAPPGFGHPPPPPYPPPGHFHWPRSYPPPTESQRNNGR